MLPTIGELIHCPEQTTPVSLGNLDSLREELAQQPGELSLPAASQLGDLLDSYVATEDDEAGQALQTIVESIVAGADEGSSIIVQGPARSGKSHLLAAIALLLEYPAARQTFRDSHPHLPAIHQALQQTPPRLIVPVPLSEHRADQEHLEDIIFDCTARELARPKYDITVPLSQQSYAMALIEQHVVPRYGEQLNERARQHVGGYTTWQQLRRREPAEAIAAAQQVAQQVGYPLDFRQSRSERLSRVLQILSEQRLGGAIWLIDDLSEFFASVDSKAAHSDCSFLEFLSQRSNIEPLHIILAIEDGWEHITGLEPYLVSSLRSLYQNSLELSTQQMTRVARQRMLQQTDTKQLSSAIKRIADAYQTAFGKASFGAEQLEQTYPLHPLAHQCIQVIIERYGRAADGLLQFAAAPARAGGLRAFEDRADFELIGPAELVDYIHTATGSHPQVSPYFNEVLDFYQRNIDQLVPEDPQVALQVIRAMVVLRLGNVPSAAATIAECLGVDENGAARLPAERARQLLEALHLSSNYVDVRRGPEPESSVYLIDAHTNLTNLVRQRLNAVKGTFASDDSRLWQRIVAASDSPALPLSELTRKQPYEVIWENTLRCVAAQIANLSNLTLSQLRACAAELADPATPEDCQLFIGQLVRVAEQRQAWTHLQEVADKARWHSGLVAWLPRPLTAEEVDVAKECAACHQLLQQPPPEVELQGAWRGRLLEEYMTLESQLRQIVVEAYYNGEISTLSSDTIPADQLPATAGDWLASLAQVSAPSFAALFPDFASVAPRRVLTSEDQISRVIAGLIAPGEVTAPPGSSIRELAEAFLAPLELVEAEGDNLRIDVSDSPVADEIMRRIRQRDQTPQHEQGRPLSCADLAQHLLKSPLGLPPHLFELTAAVLVRLGYVVALDTDQRALRFEQIELPFAAHVRYLARPALLPLSSWQALSKVVRAVLDRGISGPSLRTQHQIWQELVAGRQQQLSRLSQISQQLDQLIAALDQSAPQWEKAARDLDAATEFYEMIDPNKASSEGISEFVAGLEPHLDNDDESMLLRKLLRRVDGLEEFLQRLGPELIKVKQYVTSSLLQLPDTGQLPHRRDELLEAVESGEEIIRNQLAFHRAVQIFLTRYKRHYLNWHSQAHRNPAFEHYRRFRASPDFRALSQLQGLDIQVEYDAAQIGEIIENLIARCCHNPNLGEDLGQQPICPQCRLRLGQELQLPPVQQLQEATQEGLDQYFSALSGPSLREKLNIYAQALPPRTEVASKLQAIVGLSDQPSPRQILSLLTDDVIGHINRVLAGKTLIPRDFGQLRDALADRALTKREAQVLFATWLEGSDQELDSDDILQIEE